MIGSPPLSPEALQRMLDEMPETVPEAPHPLTHFIVSIDSNPPPKISMKETIGDDGSLALTPDGEPDPEWDRKPLWHRVGAIDDRALRRDDRGQWKGTRRIATGCGQVVESNTEVPTETTRLTETVADPYIFETRCHEAGCWPMSAEKGAA